MYVDGDRMTFVKKLRNQKWLTISALIVLLGSTVAGFYLVWGVLFLFWGVMAVRTGQAYLLEPIGRAEDPAVFWVLAGLWFVFGALYILADFYPAYLT